MHIAPGATLCGGVTVGDGAFVGAGATVIPGVIIGAGARIGAGMTILADVPEGARLAPPSAGATTIKPDGAAAEACSPEIRFAATNP